MLYEGFFTSDVWVGFPTKSSRSYNPPPLKWLILYQMWYLWVEFLKIEFETEFFYKIWSSMQILIKNFATFLKL